jgi:hypothetical protein
MGRTAPRTGVGSVHRFADVRSLERTDGSLSGSLGCWAHTHSPPVAGPRKRHGQSAGAHLWAGRVPGVVTACVTGILVRVQRSRLVAAKRAAHARRFLSAVL